MRVWLPLLLMLAPACGLRDAPRDTAEVVDEIARRQLREGSLAGFVVAVAEDGEIAFERGYGLRDIATGETMAPDAVLDYFSVGKHMTAAILLRLDERDLIDLDAPAARLLPGADFEGAPVTTRQLLMHSAGLLDPKIDDANPPRYLLDAPSGEGLVKLANNSARIAAPGDTWWYSDAGYLYAGMVAEAVSGRSLEALIAEELAAPLELERFAHCATLRKALAPAYHRFDGERRAFPLIDPSWFGGSGAVCGTARALVTWWLALRSERVVSEAALKAMFTPVEITRNGATARFGYGLGVRIGAFGGHRKLGHTGSAAGGTSVLADYPEAGLVIAVITNTGGEGATDAREIEAQIAAALLDIERPGRAAPASNDVIAAAPGLYRSVYVDALCVTASKGALRRSIDNDPPEKLRHLGDGRFSGSNESAVEYFLGAESGRAEWFALDAWGFPEDLGMRIANECP